MTKLATVPGFTVGENWFDTPSQNALADLVRDVADVDGLLVEIGSWEGRSTIAMANAAYPRCVKAIDTWQGSPGEITANLAAKRDVFAKFNANIEHYTRGNVDPYVMGWRKWVDRWENFPDVRFALVFIDAEHTYREVFDNVMAVRLLMSPGGIICGDDAHHPPIREALDEIFGLDTLEYQATLWIHRVPG